MSETWYRTSNYDDKIEPVEVVSSTDKTLYVKVGATGRMTRRSKNSTWDHHFASRDEAKAHLIERNKQRVERATEELQRCRERLVIVEAL